MSLPRIRRPFKMGEEIGRLHLNSRNAAHHVEVFLWPRQECLKGVCDIYQPTINGLCQTPSISVDNIGIPKPTERLAIVHFIKNLWNINTIAHEFFHASIHRMRVIPPYFSQVEHSESASFCQDVEEVVAYEIGEWCQKTLIWLNQMNPECDFSKLDAWEGQEIEL